MAKVVGFVGLALLAFVLAIVGSMAASGNLNRETLNRLIGRETATRTLVVEEDVIGPVAQKLKEERENLNKKAADVEEREGQLNLREQALDETLKEIRRLQEQIAGDLDTMDAERAQSLEDVAKSLSKMTPGNAASSLESWPTEEAAEILRLIKERNRGKILDAMDQKRASLLLQTMAERKY